MTYTLYLQVESEFTVGQSEGGEGGSMIMVHLLVNGA